jgi:hypothetical protein
MILLLLWIEPGLANKFQTIGSGVSGSSKIKVEYLKISAYVISGLFLVFALLAVFWKKKNAQELNYTAWKSSSVIFLLLSGLALTTAVLL